MNSIEKGPSRSAVAAVWVVSILIAIVVAVSTNDVILGVIAGAPCIAIGVGLLRLWNGGGTPRPRQP